MPVKSEAIGRVHIRIQFGQDSIMIKISIVSFVAFFVSGCGCYQERTYFQEKVKPLSYNGLVNSKYIDSTDRMTPKVRFSDYNTINVDIYEMYDEISPGDSITKYKGSLLHTLKKNDGLIKKYYPICDK